EHLRPPARTVSPAPAPGGGTGPTGTGVKGLPRFSAAAALLAACACTPPSARRAERITPNDNRHPAGALRDSALTVDLEVRRGRWYPEADDGPSVEVLAFAEGGRRPLQI